jgi:LacI family transcriptional regulator
MVAKPRTGKKTTMQDVAALAGVSQSTVSVVVNKREAEIGISEETRERVLAVIEKLGYRPNLAARGLRLQRSRTFGLVTDSVASSPFAGRMLLGAQDVAWKNDHLLLVVNTAGNPAIEKSAVEALIDRGVDGLLYAAMSWREVDMPPSFDTLPAVLVNCWSAPATRVSAVVPCEVAGGRLAAEDLIGHGHRRIAYVGGDPAQDAEIERQIGFRLAMQSAGLEVEEQWVLAGDYEMLTGYQLVAALFGTDDGVRPTGLVCGNDRMAAGAILALKDCGRSVPADVSVIGYDDQEGLADQFTPALTTVSIPHYEMGCTAVEHLLGMLADGSSEGQPPAVIPVAGRLVRRASVALPASI